VKISFFLLACALGAHAAPAKTLRWGGDSSGGAPFVFQDPKNPAITVGFEADLADWLDPVRAVDRRDLPGGPARSRVLAEIKRLERALRVP
jgi:hypothetical protein